MDGNLRGNKSVWSVIPEAFKVMFIAGIFSQNKYSLVGTTGTGDSMLFTYFLKKIINGRKQQANQHKNSYLFEITQASIHLRKWKISWKTKMQAY